MIKLPMDTPITGKLVGKLVSKFKNIYLPRLQKLGAYYYGDHDIMGRTLSDPEKPNNKLVNNYCRYITNTVSGYFMGKAVKYKSDNTDYLNTYDDITEDNFEEDENYELCKMASIYGVGCEIIYQNEEGKTRFKRIDPPEVIPVFDTSIEGFLTFVIRFYDWEDADDVQYEDAYVYTNTEIIKYSKRKNEAEYSEVDRKTHYFKEIPIILYMNNEAMESDFEPIFSIQDEYNKAQSDTANDLEYFTDAYLVMKGVGEEDDKDEKSDKRNNRIIILPDEKADAFFLAKNINDQATENYKNRLNDDTHKFSNTPDMTDEKFGGNLSGVAIKYKILPLEFLCIDKERKFRTALKKRRELITNILNVKKANGWDYREIREEFERNIPQNEKDDTETVVMIADYISRRTLLELLPQIENVDEELKRLDEEKKEQKENMGFRDEEDDQVDDDENDLE